MGDGFDRAELILRAREGSIARERWTLRQVSELRPEMFSVRRRESLALDLGVEVADLVSKQRQLDIRKMTLWELGRAMRDLEKTGANTEAMATLWHQKLAYAFSLIVMTLVGLAAARSGRNTVLVICLGLLVGFIFYGLFVLGGQMGERGVLSPWLGGWFGALFVGVPALFWLLFTLYAGRVKRRIRH